MDQRTATATAQPSGVARAAVLAGGLSVTFLVILALLHGLEPEFDPAWRMISEYELGRYGWLMTLAFWCWSGSVFTLLWALWPWLQSLSGRVARGWLGVIGVALVGAGIFITNPITDPTPRTANSLHALCGAIVILTFPVAATLVARSLAQQPDWAAARRRIVWTTALLWLSMLAFFGSMLVSNLTDPTAGRVGPKVFLGWPNRLNVVACHAWILLVAYHAAHIVRQRPVRERSLPVR